MPNSIVEQVHALQGAIGTTEPNLIVSLREDKLDVERC